MKVVIKLKDTLRNRGMTQKQLAQMLQVSEATLCDLVNTTTSFDQELMGKIATVLEITDIRELITFEEKE